eukprot:6947042-Pyramimonas_sp.AAC.1
MENIGALGEMSRLGAILSNQQQGPTSGPTATAPGTAATPAATPTTPTPATELANALTQILEGDGSQRASQVTRVQQTVNRLQGLVFTRPMGSNNFDEQLEQSEAIRELRASLATMSDTVATH